MSFYKILTWHPRNHWLLGQYLLAVGRTYFTDKHRNIHLFMNASFRTMKEAHWWMVSIETWWFSFHLQKLGDYREDYVKTMEEHAA